MKMTFYFPCHRKPNNEPLALEWAAACYERLGAQEDFIRNGQKGMSADSPYVKAAHQAEVDALATAMR